MADPTNVFAMDDIKFMTGLNVEPVIASEASIQMAIGKYYSGSRQIDIFDAAISGDAGKAGSKNGKNGHLKNGFSKGLKIGKSASDKISDGDLQLDVDIDNFEFGEHEGE